MSPGEHSPSQLASRAPLATRPCGASLGLRALVVLALPVWSICVGPLAHAGEVERAASPTRVRVSAGVDYSQGQFGGEDDIRILYVPLSIRIDRGRFGAKVTVPHLRVTGRGPRERSSGLGDITATATYELIAPDDGQLGITLKGKVKLPTSDRSLRFGTGETDYTAEIEARQRKGPWVYFLSAGYRLVGEASGQELEDRRLLSGGVSYRLSSSLAAGLLYELREASRRRQDSSQELVPFVSAQVAPRLRLTSYLTIGLTDASPDLGLGMSLTYLYR